MERPIDANKLKAVLQNMAEHLTENGDALIASCLLYCQEVVDQQRTMDAVPVVRCRECKHRNGTLCYMIAGGPPPIGTGDDYFCAYGERR